MSTPCAIEIYAGPGPSRLAVQIVEFPTVASHASTLAGPLMLCAALRLAPSWDDDRSTLPED